MIRQISSVFWAWILVYTKSFIHGLLETGYGFVHDKVALEFAEQAQYN